MLIKAAADSIDGSTTYLSVEFHTITASMVAIAYSQQALNSSGAPLSGQ